MTDQRVRSELIRECAIALEHLIDIFVQFETRFHFFTTTFIHHTITALKDTLVIFSTTLQWIPPHPIPVKEAEVHQFFLLVFNEILTFNATFPRLSPQEKSRAVRQIQRQCRILHYLFQDCYH